MSNNELSLFELDLLIHIKSVMLNIAYRGGIFIFGCYRRLDL